MSFRQITIHDVAKRAQVSVSTVSNVLTGNRPVSEGTRDRVLQIVEETGYRPNRLARSLVSRSSKTIGVVASGLEFFGPSRTLVGIEQEASERGYALILSLIHEPATEDVEPVVANLITHQVDGIVWAIPEIGRNRAWWRAAVNSLPIPVVFLNHQVWPGSECVDVDNCYGGYIATNHLLASGFQHIGLITGPQTWFAAEMRRKGWEEALCGAGRSVDRRQIAVGDWSPQSGEQALYALRAAYPEMDAVFVSNDQMAIGAMRAASDLNLRVPDDLAIVGFDDIPEAAFTQPRLTTIRQPVIEVGRLSVATLTDIIAAENDAAAHGRQSPILLQPELIVRESSRAKHKTS
jgi:LacI family transcriptional regulator